MEFMLCAKLVKSSHGGRQLPQGVFTISTLKGQRPGACVIKLIFPYYGHMTVIRKNHHGQNISVFKALFLCSL